MVEKFNISECYMEIFCEKIAGLFLSGKVCLREEVYEQRTWYNTNKRVKVRELATQTTAYYDEVQLASNNVYSTLYPPPPDRTVSVKVSVLVYSWPPRPPPTMMSSS